METSIQKWGNSLAVRLPRSIVRGKSLGEGARVVVVETEKGILIEPTKNQTHTLRALLKGVSKENVHQETSWGTNSGAEIW